MFTDTCKLTFNGELYSLMKQFWLDGMHIESWLYSSHNKLDAVKYANQHNIQITEYVRYR